MADCDVDAADLYLVLASSGTVQHSFSGGGKARIRSGHCIACGKCEEVCRFDAVFFDGPGNGAYPRTYRIDPVLCEGCGVCAWFCAENAIAFEPSDSGLWFVSSTPRGPLVHARLNAGEENSGKLVTTVRNEARNIAVRDNTDLIIVDGPPGIGCPVIASVSGVDYILVVTEPTAAGFHDLDRVIGLARHFGIPFGVAINKYDLNEGVTQSITGHVSSQGGEVLGTIRYDRAVTDAMVRGKTVVDFTDGPVAEDIKQLWNRVSLALAATGDNTANGETA
jgi:MinD superfamily P-loop ATPase